MENLQLNITPTGSEFVIREGSALEAKSAKSIKIDGVLDAPYQFKIGKKLDPLTCHIKIRKDKGEIALIAQDTDPYTTHEITGRLTYDTVLAQFHINKEKRWTVQEFLKFVKMMKFFFADKAAHTKLIESLQKWSVKVERVINEHNDNKGNSNFQLETKVREVELLSMFDLYIPIFQGYDKKKFTVEIGLDPKNVSVDLFLISDELFELEIRERESLIADAIEKFNDFPCSKITVS
jgi:hypothetical protein